MSTPLDSSINTRSGSTTSGNSRTGFLDYKFNPQRLVELHTNFDHPPADSKTKYRSLPAKHHEADTWHWRFFKAAQEPVREKHGLLRLWQDEFETESTGDEWCYGERQVNRQIARLYLRARKLYSPRPEDRNFEKPEMLQLDLTLEERLLAIETDLRTNKRIVMDVIGVNNVAEFVIGPNLWDDQLISRGKCAKPLDRP